MKPTSPQTQPDGSSLDAWDQVFVSQENIFALASHLEDSHCASDHPEDQVVSHIGRIIAGEARRLKSALDVLESQQSQPPEKSRCAQQPRRRKR